MTVLPVYLIKNRSNGLEMKSKILSFCCVLAVLSKNRCILQGIDLTDCLQLGIH